MLIKEEAPNPNHRIGGLILAVAFVILALLGASLYYNDGWLIYTLDDPYIHLALAEHIAHGHYGLNDGEFAAPSSTVLWPFLLAPWALLSWAHWIPLGINIVICLLTVTLLQRTLRHIYPTHAGWLAFALIFMTNGIGVVFTGMEHSLQVLLAVAIVSAMIDLTEQRPLPAWLPAALVIAPLIRYELLSISLGAVGLLCCHRHYRYLVSAGIALLILSGFSFYLWQHTGAILPASVMIKLHDSNSFIGIIPILLEALLAAVLIFGFRKQPRRLLFCVYLFSVLSAHLMFGKSGWFSRYEVYALSSAGLALLYYFPLSNVSQFMQKPADKLIGISVIVAVSFNYLMTTLSVPNAAHNIYSQQVQMRRLLDDSGLSRVAVNDIGYISFRNKGYVLDLWGLSQSEIAKMRFENQPEWLNVVSRYHVPLVMIYQTWYPPSAIPKNWILMGTLELKTSTFFLDSIGSKHVSVYATAPAAAKLLKPVIARWQQGLPQNAIWH